VRGVSTANQSSYDVTTGKRILHFINRVKSGRQPPPGTP